MKDDDIINEDSINDLIQYSEDENTPPEPELIQEINSESDKNHSIFDESSDEELYTVTKHKNRHKNKHDDYTFEEIEEFIAEPDKGTSKKGVIIGVLIGIIAVIAFISIDSGVIGNYKNTFSQNFSNIFSNFKSDKQQLSLDDPTPTPEVYNSEVISNVIVPLDDANVTEFASYRNGVICAKMNHLSFIDKSGEIVWETKTAIVNPIVRVDGNYILLAEKGRNKICLYNDRNLVYDVDDPDAIMTAELSSNGDVIVVTNKSSYKGGISVYNKAGSQIFSWASGSDKVICADISAASRRVAVALLNTETTAKTVISLFDVNQTESYSKINIDDTVIFNMKFVGSTLNAYGDNRIVGIAESGKVIYDNVFSNVQLTHTSMDKNGNSLLSFDDGNIPIISMYNKRGTLKESITLSGVTDFIDVNNKDILYNIGRDVYFGGIGSKIMSKYTSTMDIRDLIILSKDSFVIVYSNSLEVVTM